MPFDYRGQTVLMTATAKLWDELLTAKLTDESSLHSLGRDFGISPTTVMRSAKRLGHWSAEWIDQPKVQLQYAAAGPRLLDRHRAAWANFRAAGQLVAARDQNHQRDCDDLEHATTPAAHKVGAGR